MKLCRQSSWHHSDILRSLHSDSSESIHYKKLQSFLKQHKLQTPHIQFNDFFFLSAASSCSMLKSCEYNAALFHYGGDFVIIPGVRFSFSFTHKHSLSLLVDAISWGFYIPSNMIFYTFRGVGHIRRMRYTKTWAPCTRWFPCNCLVQQS